MKLFITRGLPGSGKTTYAKAMVADPEANAVRVNRDDIRIEMLGITTGVGSHDQERLVTEIQHIMVKKFLRFGMNVIVDDCNLAQKYARAWADIAVECGAEFDVIDFTVVPMAMCRSRVRARAAAGGRDVPDHVIESMHMRYLNAGKLPDVFPTQKGVAEITVYTRDLTKYPAYIFDIDGTLAQMSPERSPYDWNKVHLDTVNTEVRQILWDLSEWAKILIVSGRDGACYQLTADWLAKNEIEYTNLYMRARGDNRKDNLIKSEIFWNSIAPHYGVIGVFDDRNQVVEMWRGLGLLCCQVAQGDF